VTGPAGFALTSGRTGWGRVVRGPQYVAAPRFADAAPALLRAARSAGLSALGVGLGRSYGDSGLNLGQAVIDMTRCDRVLAFDPVSGLLRAEAGMALGDLIRRVAPYGWFLPTTPGSRFVTLGGAVANDVHGKNHHRAGTFGASVTRLGLFRSDRGYVEAAPGEDTELFQATVGGLGLTGVVLWVELRLAAIGGTRLDQSAVPFPDLAAFFALAAEAQRRFEHVVAWVDCTARGAALGRGVLFRADWRADGRFDLPREAGRRILPVDLPGRALNPLTLRLLNTLYRVAAGRRRTVVRRYDQVFYPLDAIEGWNRAYGARGFFQYQCVIPPRPGPDAIRALLAEVTGAGEGSTLAVLKLFGDRPSPGLLSFPFEGVTLALDFANRGEASLRLLSRLDAIVAAAGGRLYPAKDSRMPSALFRAGYPGLARFSGLVDPALSSSFWRRVADG
jgi:L-gulonolactone oxidase